MATPFEKYGKLHVEAHEIAIFARKLAVLRDDERDVLGHAALPLLCVLFYFKFFFVHF